MSDEEESDVDGQKMEIQMSKEVCFFNSIDYKRVKGAPWR